MSYCTVNDVRFLTGVTEGMLADSEIEGLIAFSDQQIDDDIQAFSTPIPTRVKHLSALLTAVKIYTRPDFRGGFSIGDFSVSEQQIDEALKRWEREVRRIYAYFGKVIEEAPSSMKVA